MVTCLSLCIMIVAWIGTRGGGGGFTLIFSYIRRLGSFLGVQNFEFRYFFYFFWGGGSEKQIFLGV